MTLGVNPNLYCPFHIHKLFDIQKGEITRVYLVHKISRQREIIKFEVAHRVLIGAWNALPYGMEWGKFAP